jgi:FtsP/CotA-like multicopper oxidase with cupredoxin domain
VGLCAAGVQQHHRATVRSRPRNLFAKRGRDRIGKVYVKAVYREYIDATLSRLKPRPPRWQHLDVLGPVIQAEVGDTVVVHFRRQHPLSMSVHLHGSSTARTPRALLVDRR